jgi:hypothetical protein
VWRPAIGITQIGAAILAGLTPWKGGGFGMFATVDSPKSRALFVTGVDGVGARYRIDLPNTSFRDVVPFSVKYLERLLAAPTNRQLSELGTVIIVSQLVEGRAQAVVPRRLALSPYAARLNEMSSTGRYRRLNIVKQSAGRPLVELQRLTVSVVGLDRWRGTGDLKLKVVRSADVVRPPAHAPLHYGPMHK